MDYTFDVSPMPAGDDDGGGARTATGGTRIVYAATIEVRVPVPLPARARAAIEQSMVDSFDTLCDRFIRYAASKLGGGDPIRVHGAGGGRSSSDSLSDDAAAAAGRAGTGAPPAAAAAPPATPRLTIKTGREAGARLRRASMEGAAGGGAPPTPGTARRRVSVDLKPGAVLLEGDVFYDAREE